MARKVDTLGELVEQSKLLEAAGRRVQGERTLGMPDDEINDLVSDYQQWFAQALAVLPSEYEERFRGEYNGGLISPKIKKFFEAPGMKNLLFNEEEGTDLLPYWQHPHETAFHGPLLAQRQILVEAQQRLLGEGHSEEIELVERICRGFGEFLVPLANRQRDRPPIVPEDEYDVQDLLHGLLRIFFEDVRPEDFAPEHGGAKSRIDFVLKSERIVVEAKMTRANLGAKKVGEELIVDIERYRSYPDCDAIVALVYDPEKRITNRRALEADLSGERNGLTIRVIVTQ